MNKKTYLGLAVLFVFLMGGRSLLAGGSSFDDDDSGLCGCSCLDDRPVYNSTSSQRSTHSPPPPTSVTPPPVQIKPLKVVIRQLEKPRSTKVIEKVCVAKGKYPKWYVDGLLPEGANLEATFICNGWVWKLRIKKNPVVHPGDLIKICGWAK